MDFNPPRPNMSPGGSGQNKEEEKEKKNFNPSKKEEKDYTIPPEYKGFIPPDWNVYGEQNNLVKALKKLPANDNNRTEIERKLCPDSHSSKYEFKVKDIWTIQNPKTYGRYAQTIKEYENWFGREPSFDQLFHGTQSRNVESIIDNNFDLRHVGTKDSYYPAGKGVYFTSKAAYADWAVGDYEGPSRFMFYCEVLSDEIKYVKNHPVSIASVCNKGPPARPGKEKEVSRLRKEGETPHRSLLYDTTSPEGKDSYVKFQSDEFYPTHLIMYERYPLGKAKA